MSLKGEIKTHSAGCSLLSLLSFGCSFLANCLSTAAATFRQAVALIFDRVVSAESLPAGKFGSGVYISRSSSVSSDVNRNINQQEYVHILMIFLTATHPNIKMDLVFSVLFSACLATFYYIPLMVIQQLNR